MQWIWGWPSILAGWREVGFGTILAALTLLVATYFVRAHRMHDYFPRETAGRFLRLFRVTQVHNILNIMLPFRAGETSFPLLMRSEFGVPLAHGTSALLVLRLLDLHALLAAAGVGLIMETGYALWACGLWILFLGSPLLVFPFHDPVLRAARRKLPAKFSKLVDQIADGIPQDLAAFVRAWALDRSELGRQGAGARLGAGADGRRPARRMLRRRAGWRAVVGTAGPCAGRRRHLSGRHHRWRCGLRRR